MENTENTTNLIKIPIEDEVKQAFIDYSMSVVRFLIPEMV